MKYKSIYQTQYIRIKVITNSRRIHELIENHLDFGNNANHIKPEIDLEFYLNDNFTKNTSETHKFVYNRLINENNVFSSSIGKKLVNVIADPNKRRVDGNAVNCDALSQEQMLSFLFVAPLRFLLAQHGLFFIHASMVGRDNDCILISGNQNCGKSTLALTLAQNGFHFLADDDCFVKSREKKTEIFPFPTKLGLHDRNLNRYPQFNKYMLKNYRYGGKRRFSLNSFQQYNSTKGYNCKMIIFPAYKQISKIHIKEISNNKALDRLIDENLIPDRRDRRELTFKNFWTLCELTKRTNSFKLAYNDNRLNEIPKMLEKILK